MKILKLKYWQDRPNNFAGIIEYSNYRTWFKFGKFHRLDGPAIEWANGDRFYYVEGIQYTEQEFRSKFGLKKDIRRLL